MNGHLIPVTILTGFLGSGKTTILSRLVRDPDFVDTAIIVNEFGEVGIDHTLLEASEETIIDLSCGCICCTIRGDLMSTLTDLYDRRAAGTLRPFQRVVIETTGLADPAPIIHTIMQEPTIFRSFRLARIVTVLDAANGMSTLHDYPEAVKQVAVAAGLLLTKVDLVEDPGVLQKFMAQLQKINPRAPRTTCPHGSVSPSFLFSGGVYDPDEKGADALEWLSGSDPLSHDNKLGTHRHNADISTFVIRRKSPVSRGALSGFMQMLAEQKGEELLRLKGLVKLKDDPTKPALVHGVQHVVHPVTRLDHWPQTSDTTKLVFIVRNIEKDWIEDLWDKISESAYAEVSL